MGHYLLRRLLIALPAVLGISVVLFTVLALAPGDPFAEMALNPNVPPEVQANLRKQFGLDDPVWQRYFRWLLATLQGDWGFSFISRVNVDDLILGRLPVTLAVIGASMEIRLPFATETTVRSQTMSREPGRQLGPCRSPPRSSMPIAAIHSFVLGRRMKIVSPGLRLCDPLTRKLIALTGTYPSATDDESPIVVPSFPPIAISVRRSTPAATSTVSPGCATSTAA